jgi:F-type H+-transporting ATPase subunit b
MVLKKFGRQERLKNISLGAVVLLVVMLMVTVGAAWASSSGGHGEPKVWEWTDTYRVMNFVVLAVALFFVLRKPAAQFLNGRIQGIKDQLAELENKKKEAEKQLAQYNERLSLLDKEAEKIVSMYVQQGKEAQARILEEAKASAEKLESQAKRHIEHTFQQAKMKVQEEIFENAMAKAEAKIAEKITAEDQVRLVDDYLEKVVA